jgi:hypothetical protein
VTSTHVCIELVYRAIRRRHYERPGLFRDDAGELRVALRKMLRAGRRMSDRRGNGERGQYRRQCETSKRLTIHDGLPAVLNMVSCRYEPRRTIGLIVMPFSLSSAA